MDNDATETATAVPATAINHATGSAGTPRVAVTLPDNTAHARSSTQGVVSSAFAG